MPFALLHGPQYAWSWRHVLLIAVAGSAFGWWRVYTRSTGASALMHAGYNAVLVVGYLIGRTCSVKSMVETIQWTDEGVVMIDQTRLPREQVFVTCKDYKEVAEAIRVHDHSRRAGHRRGGGDGRRDRRAEVGRSACADATRSAPRWRQRGRRR